MRALASDKFILYTTELESTIITRGEFWRCAYILGDSQFTFFAVISSMGPCNTLYIRLLRNQNWSCWWFFFSLLLMPRYRTIIFLRCFFRIHKYYNNNDNWIFFCFDPIYAIFWDIRRHRSFISHFLEYFLSLITFLYKINVDHLKLWFKNIALGQLNYNSNDKQW